MSGVIWPLSEAALAHATALLRKDEVCAFPTETVYGLGGNALSAAAIERIYALKGRPRHNPLIVHVPDAAAAEALAAGWPERAQRLAAHFWPGPLTVVVPRGPAIPPIVSAGRSTVALRVPRHEAALRLLRACRLPLAAPSANRSEQLSPTTALHVLRSLPEVPMILDGGPCALGIESTVVDLTSEPPRLLRPGALPLVALREVLPELAAPGDAVAVLAVPDGEAPASPGMLARHYAPRARLWLVPELDEAAALALPGPRGLLTHEPASTSASVFAHIERLPDDPLGYAADLYAALHRLDDAGVQSIVALTPPSPRSGDWLAIHDRLKRAAHPKAAS